MRKEQWEQIEQLWQQAQNLPEQEQLIFVQTAPVSDEIVRQEVLAMLQHEASDADFLAAPAMEDAARQLAHEHLNSSTHIKSGQQLGNYEIIKQIGAGGMGTVYLARDLNLPRQVAVKVLPEFLAEEPDRLKRFKREAEMLAQMNHPNIAALVDYDRENSNAPRFLVMEFVPGETLAERLDRGQLEFQAIASIFRQIAAALKAAHAQGVIHRDLKPANIKITPDGAIKVLDFGLAKSTAPKATIADTAATRARHKITPAPTLTQPQMILGTPGYMSPEQVRGESNLDQRCDWWAFGCMLYETLTGENPFRAASNADTNAAILTKEPDWQALPINTPPRLVKLVHRCLQKNVVQRLRQADEAIQLLENVKENSPLTNLLLHSRRFAPHIGLAAAALALLVFGFWAYKKLLPQAPITLAIVPTTIDLPCQQSEIIAMLLNDKLKDVRGIQLLPKVASERSQPFLMIDATAAQAALTQGASNVLKISAVDCSGTNAAINYSLTNRQGKEIQGRVTDVNQLLASVISVLDLKNAGTIQASEQDRNYFRAVALLEPLVNESVIDEAIEILNKLEKSDDKNLARIKGALALAWRYKFTHSQKLPDRDKAVSYCEQATKIDALQKDVLLFCGQVALAINDNDQAIAKFQRVLQQENNPSAQIGLAQAYENKSDFEAAEKAYQQAIAQRPDFWYAYNEMAGFYFERGNFAKAEVNSKKVTELLENNAYGFNNLALTLLYQEKLDVAFDTFRKALSLNHHPQIYQSMGAAYLLAGDCPKALEAFQNGLRAEPTSPELTGALGDAYSCDKTQKKAADNQYAQAIAGLSQMDISQDAYSLSLLADWQAQRGNKPQALEKIHAALVLEPSNQEVIMSAVRVFRLTNQANELEIYLPKVAQNPKSIFEIKHDPLLKTLLLEKKYQSLIK